jgi:hypothetical protein
MEKGFSRPGKSLFKGTACFVVFVSAFLLFQVQPLLGKYFLPFFGGSSSVWMTSVFFFQAVLVAGYFYAQRLSRAMGRVQLLVHVSLALCLSLILLYFWTLWQSPITPPVDTSRFSSLPPAIYLVILLFCGVGAPYFLLTTTSSLVQQWYRVRLGEDSPYYLYAISNVGSVLGLVSFPFVFEPLFTTQRQAGIWSRLFLVYVLSLLTYIFFVKKMAHKSAPPQALQMDCAKESKRRKDFFLWCAIPFLTTVLFLSATNTLTNSVASIPFLWILPLVIYLMSFVLCFADSPLTRKEPFLAVLTIVGLLGLACLSYYDFRISFWLHIGIVSFYLFCACLLLHGQLYRLRPRHDRLTTYYLAIACGGALGGFFVALIAPLLFNEYYEFLLSAGITMSIAFWCGSKPFVQQKKHVFHRAVAVLVCVLSAVFFIWFMAAAAYKAGRSLEKRRNFYGLLDVREYRRESDLSFRLLRHGSINHGIQSLDAQYELFPSAYFYPESGVGTVLLRHAAREADRPLDIGVVGLGIGTLAAYGRPGDTSTFYEIDPEVEALARTYFTYMQKTLAEVKTVFGDGRLNLQRNAESSAPQKYDVLILDAFSGGTIPVHLVTKEAFLVYEKCLKDEQSIIAMNITNKFVSLVPQIKSLSVALDLEFVIIETKGDGQLRYDATWAVMTRDKKFIEENFIIIKEPEQIEGCALWTDSYSNVLTTLK